MKMTKHDFQRNKMWYQAYQDFPIYMSELLNLGKNAGKVLMCLVYCTNRQSACAISERDLKECTGIGSTRTVERSIKKLVRNNCIAVTDIGKQHVYITNPYLLWQESQASRDRIAHKYFFTTNICMPNTKENKIRIHQFLNSRILADRRNINLSKRTYNGNHMKLEHIRNKEINFQTGTISDDSKKKQKYNSSHAKDEHEIKLLKAKIAKMKKQQDNSLKLPDKNKHNNKANELSKILAEQKNDILGK